MAGVPTFASYPSFLSTRKTTPDARYCVAGVPYDIATSFRPGARFGGRHGAVGGALVVIRVLVVDDEEPARARLASLLSAFPDVEIVGEAADGPEAIERVAKAAREHKIHWAILPPNRDYAQRCLDLGCRMLSVGWDTWTVQRGLRAYAQEFKELTLQK